MLMRSRAEQAQMVKARHEAVLITMFARSGKARGRIACPHCGTGTVTAELGERGKTSGKCSTAGCVEWTT